MPGTILVIGGGLIGSAIAWRLSQRGSRVTVADAGNLGGEASPAGAGMLSPGAEAGGHGAILSSGIESLALYPAFVDELRAETGLAIDFRITGCMVFGDAKPPGGIRAEPRSGGLFYPDDALVDPVHLLTALRCAAERRGVSIERRTVSAVEAGAYEAVVIAAGAWSSEIQVTHQGQALNLPRSEPVKGHLIGFGMTRGLMGPFLRREHIYVLQRADGFVIAGSNEQRVGFDTSIDAEICANIHAQAAQLLQELEHVEPSKRWIGFRPRVPGSDTPFLEQVPGTNVWLAYGHYRNGILLTPVTAKRISEAIGSH